MVWFQMKFGTLPHSLGFIGSCYSTTHLPRTCKAALLFTIKINITYHLFLSPFAASLAVL